MMSTSSATSARASTSADDSVGVIRAVDFLEHIADKIALQRALPAPGARWHAACRRPRAPTAEAHTRTPPTSRSTTRTRSGTSPTAQYRNFVPQIKARVSNSRLVTYFPTEWHEQHIPYVCANLIALKDGTPRNGGRLFI